MAMFTTFDRSGGAEFPFSRDVVFRAVSEAVGGISGIQVEHSDPLAGRLSIKTGMSAFSWGERVTVTVAANGGRAAQVQIGSAPKTVFGSATTHSKNQKNVEQILRATSDVLQRFGAVWEAEGNSTAIENREVTSTPPEGSTVESRLRKLTLLRTEGLITDQDFERRKAEILKDV